jgi:hypothetical protein
MQDFSRKSSLDNHRDVPGSLNRGHPGQIMGRRSMKHPTGGSSWRSFWRQHCRCRVFAQAYPANRSNLCLGTGRSYDIVLRGFSPALTGARPAACHRKPHRRKLRSPGRIVREGDPGRLHAVHGRRVHHSAQHPRVFKLPYSAKDFAPISSLTSVCRADRESSLPVNSLQELLALAKQKPDSIAFARPDRRPMPACTSSTGGRTIPPHF